uniref:Uncharacterized protein n=1 Tax=Arundo donax TaxID=35708 RepID=A0A0A9CZ15_ARUDO
MQMNGKPCLLWEHQYQLEPSQFWKLPFGKPSFVSILECTVSKNHHRVLQPKMMVTSLYWSALWLHGLLEHFSPSLNTF